MCSTYIKHTADSRETINWHLKVKAILLKAKAYYCRGGNGVYFSRPENITHGEGCTRLFRFL